MTSIAGIGALAMLVAGSMLATPPLVAQTAPAAAGASTNATQSERIRVLVVAGPGGFFETSFFDLFKPYENLETTVAWSDSEAFATPIAGRYDVLVLVNRSPTLAETGRANLKAYVEQGGGLVIVNQALASYADWPWWYGEVTGGRYLSAPEAGRPNSSFRLNEPMIVNPVGTHPILKRLEGLPFHIFDETYKNVWMADGLAILLRTRNSTSDGPLLWIGPYRKARVVVHVLGYGHGAHMNLAFRHLMEDSVRWAAGRL